MTLRLTLLLALLPVYAVAQGTQHGKGGPSAHSTGNTAGNHVSEDERVKRREELRAALKAQNDDAQATAARGTTAGERAALREQLRLNAANAGLQQ